MFAATSAGVDDPVLRPDDDRRSWHSVRMPELNQSDPDRNEPEPEVDDAPTSVRDSWWWSPAFAIVIGVVVVLFQVGPIGESGGVWLNWVVAGVGISLAATGVARLVRAYPR